MALPLKSREECGFDAVSLGEVMLRLDPGEGRIRTSREFHAWEGGGEYNVTRGLKKCFNLRTAVVSAFVDNEVGHLIEDCIMQGGVCTDYVVWRDFKKVWAYGFTRRYYKYKIQRNYWAIFCCLA